MTGRSNWEVFCFGFFGCVSMLHGMNTDNMDSFTLRHDSVRTCQHTKQEPQDTPIQTPHGVWPTCYPQDRLYPGSTPLVDSINLTSWTLLPEHTSLHLSHSSSSGQHQGTIPVCSSLPTSWPLWQVTFLSNSPSPVWQHQSTSTSSF
jgi:hypothetical protein